MRHIQVVAAIIRQGDKVFAIQWDYPSFHLTMHCFICSLKSGSLHLNEHEAARWLGPGSIRSVQWLPADNQLIPLIERELAAKALDQVIQASDYPVK